MSAALALTLACLAHRGQVANQSADEETRQAIHTAFEQGCDVELDVHLTKDNVPVMQHDPTLARTLGEPGVVHDYTAAQYLSFRTQHGQKPITYATALKVLAKYPQRSLTIEVWPGWWNTNTLAALQTAAVDAGVADRVTLYAGNRTRLAQIHAAAPDLRLGIKGLHATATPESIPDYLTTVFLDGSASSETVLRFEESGRWVVAANSLTSSDFSIADASGFDAISTNRTKAWQRWAN